MKSEKCFLLVIIEFEMSGIQFFERVFDGMISDYLLYRTEISMLTVCSNPEALLSQDIFLIGYLKEELRYDNSMKLLHFEKNSFFLRQLLL